MFSCNYSQLNVDNNKKSQVIIIITVTVIWFSTLSLLKMQQPCKLCALCGSVLDFKKKKKYNICDIKAIRA